MTRSCVTSLVPVEAVIDAVAMTWNDPVPYQTGGARVASDPAVILRSMKQRGVRLEGLAEEKLRLRLKICVKRGWLSLTQSVAVREHLLKR